MLLFSLGLVLLSYFFLSESGALGVPHLGVVKIRSIAILPALKLL